MPESAIPEEEPTSDLIPTGRKAKLPKGYSYPIGTEILSRGLADVPQYDELTVYFRWRDDYWASDYQKKIKTNGKIRVIEVDGRFSRIYGQSWSVRIAAVPSEHNHKVKSLIRTDALTHLRDSLFEAGRDASYFSWKAVYDLAEQTLEIHQ